MVAIYLLGGIPVYTFSILVGLGAALGLAWLVREAPSERLPRLFKAGLWTGLGALLGGRVAFVGFYWPYFQDRPAEVLQIYLGGLSWAGALGGALVTLILYALLTRQSLGELADSLLPLAASVTVSAWLGCWLSGSAYGASASTWWGLPAQDEWGQVSLRFPVQMLGALLALGLFWALDLSRERLKHAGQTASLGLLGLSLELFGLSILRADPSILWHGLRLEAWIALAFIVIAIVAILLTSLPIFQSTNS